VLEVLLLLLL